MPEQEEWRPVVGFPDYLVSDQGRVASLRRRRTPRLMRPSPSGNGYLTVSVRIADYTPRTRTVHSLVAEAFIGPRPDGQEVRHLDGDRHHNALINLAHGTRSENVCDSVRHGTHVYSRATHCKWGHPLPEEKTGRQRKCRPCANAASRRYQIRKALRAASVPTAVAA